VSLHILRLKNETNIPFDLIKIHLLPFALTAKLCMWMPPFLSRNWWRCIILLQLTTGD